MNEVSKTPTKRRVGDGTPGPGRPKGSKNRATVRAQDAIARFVDANAERLSEWLEEVYQRDGAKAAFQCFTDLVEYHVPKLARVEHGGEITLKTAAEELAELNAAAAIAKASSSSSVA